MKQVLCHFKHCSSIHWMCREASVDQTLPRSFFFHEGLSPSVHQVMALLILQRQGRGKLAKVTLLRCWNSSHLACDTGSFPGPLCGDSSHDQNDAGKNSII